MSFEQFKRFVTDNQVELGVAEIREPSAPPAHVVLVGEARCQWQAIYRAAFLLGVVAKDGSNENTQYFYQYLTYPEIDMAAAAEEQRADSP